MRRPVGRGACLAIAGALLSVMLAGPAAGAGPKAEVYSFLLPSADYSALVRDTRAAGDSAVSRLNSAGYGTADINNVSAATSLNSTHAQTDAIWAYAGHGRAGAVVFWNGSSYSEVAGESGVSSYGYPMTYLASTAGLGDVRLMVFLACHSAETTSSYLTQYGSLTRNAYYSRKVDMVIGFTGLITVPYYKLWSDMFYTNLQQGKTLSTAASNAAGYIESQTLGADQSFDHYVTYNGAGKITPAGFGS